MEFPKTQTQIVNRLKIGGPEASAALGELVGIYTAPLMGFARSEFPGRSREEYEDMLQGFYLRCVEKHPLSEFDGSIRFRSWLMTCFRNNCRNLWRAEQAQKRMPGPGIVSLDEHLQSVGPAADPMSTETPEDTFLRIYVRIMFDKADATLRKAWQEREQGLKASVFTRRAVDRLSFELIAAEFELSVDRARSIYRAALTELRDLLREFLASDGTPRPEAYAEQQFAFAAILGE
jgi:RNA polymerase sigma factor (sigma-70 family)